jgi:hypothetical protein
MYQPAGRLALIPLINILLINLINNYLSSVVLRASTMHRGARDHAGLVHEFRNKNFEMRPQDFHSRTLLLRTV